MNSDSDCRTQASGERESLQTMRRAPPPYRRPMENHTVSAAIAAATAAVTTRAAEMLPSRESAPTTTRVGTEGTGTPSASANTFKATKATPYSVRNCINAGMAGG